MDQHFRPAKTVCARHLQKVQSQVGEAGHILVNEKLETSTPNIWALGDVHGGAGGLKSVRYRPPHARRQRKHAGHIGNNQIRPEPDRSPVLRH